MNMWRREYNQLFNKLFMDSLCTDFLSTKIYKPKFQAHKSCQKTFVQKAGYNLLLMNLFCVLRPGVKFNNVIYAAFTLEDPESIKNTVKSSVSFTLSWFAFIKVVRRTLMKLSPAMYLIWFSESTSTETYQKKR